MVGIIRRREQVKIMPFDPSSIFDPTTNTATEADFIGLLEQGIYDSNLIGKYVALSNSVEYNNGLWVIADVNHDSENTGQTNCYDLISVNCLDSQTFDSSSSITLFENSAIYAYLNNNLYSGFSNSLKSHILNIKYYCSPSWYTSAKIILPSMKEVGLTGTNGHSEGVTYPIFTDNNSRIKYSRSASNARDWWSRTNAGYGYFDAITSAGGYNRMYISNYRYIVPLFRVS